MKKFKYRIEPYLKFIEHQRDQALYLAKEAEYELNSWKSKWKELETKMKKAYNLNSRIGKEISDMRMINDNNTFIESLKDQMKDVSIEIQHAETIYQEKHQKLLQLQKKLKQIELHKEKALEDFKQKYKKHSQKLTDEINSRKLGAKMQNPYDRYKAMHHEQTTQSKRPKKKGKKAGKATNSKSLFGCQKFNLACDLLCGRTFSLFLPICVRR